MPDNKLVIFRPVLVVETFDGDMQFSNKSIEEFNELVNKSRFILFSSGVSFAVSAIKSFYRDTHGVSELNSTQLKELMGWKRKFTAEKLVEPNDELILKKINRIKNGEKII